MTPSLRTPLAQILATRTVRPDRSHFEVPDDWLQGRTSFGGLTAALSVQAMRDVAGERWPGDVQLRALQTAFIGPVAAGPVEVLVTTLREGKNVRQVQARVLQGDQTAAVLLGVFGIERDSALSPMTPTPRPVPLQPGDVATPMLGSGVPQFLHHLDFRLADGEVPFSGRPCSRNSYHLRLKDPPQPLDAELLTVLLADMPPTPALSRYPAPTPASSVSWELQLHPLAQAPAAEGWWRVDTEVLAARGGYVNQASRLWTPSGELAALGYQVVAVFG